MAQHVFTLSSEVEFHLGIVGDGSGLVALLDLHHAVAQRVEVTVLVHLQRTASALAQQFGLVLAQVHLPEVGLPFEGSEVVQTLTVLAHDGITQTTAVGRQTDDAVLQALEFNLDGLDGISISLLVVFLFVFLVVLLLVLLLEFLQQRIVFCRETITVVGILRQEGQEHVVLTAP